MRLGWFRSVHDKSLPACKLAVIGSRSLLRRDCRSRTRGLKLKAPCLQLFRPDPTIPVSTAKHSPWLGERGYRLFLELR
jgi:hypothetical protein